MIPIDVFRHPPTLIGEHVRLEPLTAAVSGPYAAALANPDVRRLTGTHATFDHAAIEGWLASRSDQHDRADWAAVRIEDNAFLGEAVLNDLDVDNRSVNYRVWLSGEPVFGKGYGTEITRLVVEYAFKTVGLHRVSLGVYDFNPRAQRVYAKCGFVHEGRLRDALFSDGQWHDELVMSVLRTEPLPC